MMHRAVVGCWLGLFAGMSLLQAGEPRWIGRTSCGAATCHGGLTDRGQAWHSSDSVWQAKDPHLLAGNVLLNPLSRRIVHALEPQAVFEDVLVERCVSCHAPAIAHEKSHQSNPQVSLRARLAEGVSCEACHGAASQWLTAHTLSTWDQQGSGRFTAEFGMKDTETLVSRVENCASCHVGSRSRDGLVRDMNHDMIAAGHPALHFDYWQSHQRLPSHWDTSREKFAAISADEAPAVYAKLRKYVLISAVRLSAERADYSQNTLRIKDFDPELSEFDCAACHHTLAIDSPRLVRGSRGDARWLPWHTTGLVSPAIQKQLHIHARDFVSYVQVFREQLQADGSSEVRAPAGDALARVRELIMAPSFVMDGGHSGTAFPGRPSNVDDGLGRPSYFEGAVWLDELEALIPKATSLSPDVRLKLQQAVVASRERLLPIKSNAPLSLQRLMPAPWSESAAEQTRRQLREIIVPSDRGAQQ